MKTKNLLMGCAVGALVASTAAWAGYKSNFYVTVNTVSRIAYGSMGAARGSTDANQSIGCTVQGFSNGTNMVICEAYNASNVSGYCTSSVPAIVTAATSQTDASYIYFTWDVNGACTQLHVGNDSSYAPRQP
jgi:hypothetical protein